MSNVRSEPLKEARRAGWTWNRLAAVIAWIGGTFTTYLFVAAAAPELFWLIGFLIAGLVQWVLTMAERPLWRFLLRRRGGKFVLLAFIVTLFDGLLNAAGLYPQLGRLPKTGLGKMIAEVLNVAPTMDARSAFLLALFFGLVIAGLPEALWEYDAKA